MGILEFVEVPVQSGAVAELNFYEDQLFRKVTDQSRFVADFGLKNGEEIVNKGEATSLIWEDFCGNQRNDMPDIGAIEYGISKPCRPLGDIE